MSEGLYDQLGDMLNDPGAMEKIKEIASGMGLGDALPEVPHAPGAVPYSVPRGGEDDPFLSGMMRLGSLYRKMNARPDHETALLSALLPYMREQSAEDARRAMRFLRLSRLLRMAKEENLFEGLLF